MSLLVACEESSSSIRRWCAVSGGSGKPLMQAVQKKDTGHDVTSEILPQHDKTIENRSDQEQV